MLLHFLVVASQKKSQVAKLATLASNLKNCNIVNVVRMLGSVFTSANGGCSCRIIMLNCKEAD